MTSIMHVADFAAGDGQLLLSCKQRWPGARLYANDLDVGVSEHLRRGAADIVDCLDFLDDGYLAASSAPTNPDLVVLNPPFGAVQGRQFACTVGDTTVKCSRSFAFLAKALSLVRPGGQVLAVMPSSSTISERDAMARQLMERAYQFEVVLGPTQGLFHPVEASICVLRVTRKASMRLLVPDGVSGSMTNFSVMRGQISMKRSERTVAKRLKGWVHTTGLFDNKVAERYVLPKGATQTHCPPGAILLPRVGRFDIRKFVLLPRFRSELISDCILAASLGSYEDNTRLYRLLLADSRAPSLYAGTGASYLTIGRLTRYVEDLLTGRNSGVG